jgi:hypothetical protein
MKSWQQHSPPAEKRDQADCQGSVGKMADEQGQNDGRGEKAHPTPETGPIQGIDQEIPAIMALDLQVNSGVIGNVSGHRRAVSHSLLVVG